jgi:hypothetical protein
MIEFETDRLRLRRLVLDDAPFILRLVNEPSWLRFIGDRGVHNLDGARQYITGGPQRLYAAYGFGLFLVESRADGQPLGLCGLISEYNTEEPVGARNLWRLIVKRASIRGLLVADYVARFGEGAAKMGEWAAQGKINIDEHVDEGIENAYSAFMRLFSGSNQGKMILKI